MTPSVAYTVALWILTTLLVYRVAGQLVVAVWSPAWLPPMNRWQSGLVPYWFLLATQCVVLYLMFSISLDFARGHGFWIRPHPWLGAVAYYWSYGYAAAMVVRYIVHMNRYPADRWTGGTIPIFFHTCVAAFQWTFGSFQVGLS
jgi:hypothetical protein